MLELLFQYHTLLSIKTKHHYYKDDSGGGFQLKPTSQTQTILQKMGMMGKLSDGQFHILYDVGKIERVEKYFTENTYLSLQFLLYSHEPYFINITEIPSEGVGKVLYFTNKGEEKYLSQQDGVSANDFYTYRGESSSYQNNQKKSIELSLKNNKGEEIWKKTLAENEKSILSMQNFPFGLYSLSENSKEIEKFVYLVKEFAQMPLALVEIDFQNKLSKTLLSKIRNQEIFSPWRFEIQFESRQTYWKYFIVPKYENSLEDLSIDTGKTKIDFKGPSNAQLPNGQAAYLFESSQTLPIQQAGQYEFQLIQNKDNKGKKNKRMVQRLPLARANAIRPVSRDVSSKIYSEIYVYL
jgi:hypothetical protein